MKTKASTLTLVLALLFLAVAGTPLVFLANANPMPDEKGLYAKFNVESPKNMTYRGSQIPLNFTVKTNSNEYPYFYFLDGQGWQASVKVVQIQLVEQAIVSDDFSVYGVQFQPYTEYTFAGQAELPVLVEGSHNITIGMCAELRGLVLGEGAFAEITVPFYIDNSLPSSSNSFPTTLAVAVFSSVAVVCTGLLVYFRKRKPKVGAA